MIHSFSESYERGMQQERRVVNYFSPAFSISPASREEQRAGLDYWFSSNGHSFSVEIKADYRTAETGNVFVETVSVGRYVDGEFEVEKLGWAHTSTADYLMYLVVGPDQLLVTTPDKIRERLENWTTSFRSVTVRNNGYQARGLLVPVDVYSGICPRVMEI